MSQSAGVDPSTSWLLANVTPASRSAGCRIVPLLRSSGRSYTAMQLHGNLGVAKNTIKRALKWLQYIGAPLEHRYGQGGWRLNDLTWSVPWEEMDDASKIAALERIITPGAKTTLIDCVSRLQVETLALRTELMRACTMPQAVAETPTPALAAVASQEEPQTLSRGERELPPDRHSSECVKVRFGQTSVYFHIGFYADGRICEASIDMSKTGDALRGWATAVGKLASHYIQIGGDIETIADSLRHIHFEPAGQNFADDASKSIVPSATSIVDAFAQVLLTYQRRHPAP